MSGSGLQVEGLTLDYVQGGRRLRALDGVSLSVAPGRIVGLIGESGSGKSSLAYAIVRYLAPNARIVAGSVVLGGEDVLAAPVARLRQLRAQAIGMVYQNPAAALNPTMRLGEQLNEALRSAGMDADGATKLLERVRLPDPAAIIRRFPHEVSGGEKQRVLIAMAIVGAPRLLIFDEPTTALDPTTAAGIVDLIRALQSETGAAVLYITHHMGIVARLADEVALMRSGTIVERGPTDAVLTRASHAYTRKLLAAVPNPFAPGAPRPVEEPREPLLRVQGLRVAYDRPDLMQQLRLRPAAPVVAVNGVDVDIRRGETVALVGESGCGKSTLARALLGLVPFSGRIGFAGRTYASAGELTRGYRRAVQIVFQNPDQSLNPRLTVGEILGRPIALADYGAGQRPSVAQTLDTVRLPAAYATRYPHQLSGGERQRVAIARAFASRPQLVICDEITSSLDVTTQAAIVALLKELQASFGTACLFISHDVNLLPGLADRLLVMYLGDIVEARPLPHMLPAPPLHPYTEALLAATPVPDPGWEARIVRLDGALPGRTQRPGGCPLQTRCPRKLGPICENAAPPLIEMGPAHRLACHIDRRVLAGFPPIWRQRTNAVQAGRSSHRRKSAE